MYRILRPAMQALLLIAMASGGNSSMRIAATNFNPTNALFEPTQFVNVNQIGFIAQDVAEVLPQLVTEDESSGLKTVAYMGVTPVLVEALKEQQQQIEAQRKELDGLKARLQ